MPANNSRGLPYPLPTEPVGGGAVAIQNLADAQALRLAGLHSGWLTFGGTYAATDPIRIVSGWGSGTTDATGLIPLPTGFTKVLIGAIVNSTGSATSGDVGVIQVDRRYTGVNSVALCPLRKSGAFLPQGVVVEFQFLLIGC